jgi:hypothetical protein
LLIYVTKITFFMELLRTNTDQKTAKTGKTGVIEKIMLVIYILYALGANF